MILWHCFDAKTIAQIDLKDIYTKYPEYELILTSICEGKKPYELILQGDIVKKGSDLNGLPLPDKSHIILCIIIDNVNNSVRNTFAFKDIFEVGEYEDDNYIPARFQLLNMFNVMNIGILGHTQNDQLRILSSQNDMYSLTNMTDKIRLEVHEINHLDNKMRGLVFMREKLMDEPPTFKFQDFDERIEINFPPSLLILSCDGALYRYLMLPLKEELRKLSLLLNKEQILAGRTIIAFNRISEYRKKFIKDKTEVIKPTNGMFGNLGSSNPNNKSTTGLFTNVVSEDQKQSLFSGIGNIKNDNSSSFPFLTSQNVMFPLPNNSNMGSIFPNNKPDSLKPLNSGGTSFGMGLSGIGSNTMQPQNSMGMSPPLNSTANAFKPLNTAEISGMGIFTKDKEQKVEKIIDPPITKVSLLIENQTGDLGKLSSPKEEIKEKHEEIKEKCEEIKEYSSKEINSSIAEEEDENAYNGPEEYKEVFFFFQEIRENIKLFTNDLHKSQRYENKFFGRMLYKKDEITNLKKEIAMIENKFDKLKDTAFLLKKTLEENNDNNPKSTEDLIKILEEFIRAIFSKNNKNKVAAFTSFNKKNNEFLKLLDEITKSVKKSQKNVNTTSEVVQKLEGFRNKMPNYAPRSAQNVSKIKITSNINPFSYYPVQLDKKNEKELSNFMKNQSKQNINEISNVSSSERKNNENSLFGTKSTRNNGEKLPILKNTTSNEKYEKTVFGSKDILEQKVYKEDKKENIEKSASNIKANEYIDEKTKYLQELLLKADKILEVLSKKSLEKTKTGKYCINLNDFEDDEEEVSDDGSCFNEKNSKENVLYVYNIENQRNFMSNLIEFTEKNLRTKTILNNRNEQVLKEFIKVPKRDPKQENIKKAEEISKKNQENLKNKRMFEESKQEEKMFIDKEIPKKEGFTFKNQKLNFSEKDEKPKKSEKDLKSDKDLKKNNQGFQTNFSTQDFIYDKKDQKIEIPQEEQKIEIKNESSKNSGIFANISEFKVNNTNNGENLNNRPQGLKKNSNIDNFQTAFLDNMNPNFQPPQEKLSEQKLSEQNNLKVNKKSIDKKTDNKEGSEIKPVGIVISNEGSKDTSEPLTGKLISNAQTNDNKQKNLGVFPEAQIIDNKSNLPGVLPNDNKSTSIGSLPATNILNMKSNEDIKTGGFFSGLSLGENKLSLSGEKNKSEGLFSNFPPLNNNKPSNTLFSGIQSNDKNSNFIPLNNPNEQNLIKNEVANKPKIESNENKPNIQNTASNTQNANQTNSEQSDSNIKKPNNPFINAQSNNLATFSQTNQNSNKSNIIQSNVSDEQIASSQINPNQRSTTQNPPAFSSFQSPQNPNFSQFSQPQNQFPQQIPAFNQYPQQLQPQLQFGGQGFIQMPQYQFGQSMPPQQMNPVPQQNLHIKTQTTHLFGKFENNLNNNNLLTFSNLKENTGNSENGNFLGQASFGGFNPTANTQNYSSSFMQPRK